MSGAWRHIGGAAALALAVAVAACRPATPDDAEPTPLTPEVIDTHEVESTLVATQRRATPDFDVRDPSCPARVVVSEGASFQCTVVVEGVIVPYQVTLADVTTKLRYNIRPARAILLIPKLVDALRAQVPGATVDCGPERIRVLDVGATFDCRLTESQGVRTVTLKVEDVLGNVSPVA